MTVLDTRGIKTLRIVEINIYQARLASSLDTGLRTRRDRRDRRLIGGT